MRLTYEQFEGMAPRLDPAGMAGGLCQYAKNAGFSKGMLAAAPIDFSNIALTNLKATVLNGTGFVSAGGMFYSHMADAWFVWPEGTIVKRGVDSLITPQDVWSRIYFADQNGPRYMTSDQYTKDAVNVSPTSFKLGVPFPLGTPVATKNSETIPADVDSADVVRQRVTYIFTVVDNYGHEGPPSDPSGPVEVPIEYPFSVNVTLPVGAMDTIGRPIGTGSKKYVYRATEGSTFAAYQFIGEVAYTATAITDTKAYGLEGEVIPSVQWFEPPAEIKEIAAVASNFLAGYYGNIIAYSEPKLSHAWPLNYRFPIKYQVKAIVPTINGLFIGTTGKPYWAFGGDPEAAVPVEMDGDFACIAPDTVVDVGGFVMYATHDGIAAVDGQQAILLSEPTFSRVEWQSLQPETMKAFSYEGRYFFYSQLTKELYAIRPDDPRTLTLIEWSGVNTLFDNLLVVERSLRYDRTILAFNSTAPVQFMEVDNKYAQNTEWESSLQKTPLGRFNFARVRGTAFPVTLTVSSDLGGTFSVNITDENPVRLGFNTKSRLWGVKVAFAGPNGEVVRDIVLTQSSGEFQDAS